MEVELAATGMKYYFSIPVVAFIKTGEMLKNRNIAA
jgi:hypothetical protein